MQKKLIDLFVIIAGAIALGSWGYLRQLPPVIGQETCSNTNDQTAVNETRTVKFEQFGIQLEIPRNFRTMLHNDGSISILKPGDFNLIRCLAQGIPVTGTDAIYPQTLRRQPNPENLSLQAFARKRSLGSSPEISQALINGFEIVFAEIQGQFDEAYAWYQVPDVPGIVEVQSLNKASLVSLLEQATPLTEASEPLLLPNQAVGKDPLIVALAAAQALGYSPESFRVTIDRQNDFTENPQYSTVTITQEGLLDDSVYGQRFFITLTRASDGTWTIDDLQTTWRCQRGRNPGIYSPELCP